MVALILIDSAYGKGEEARPMIFWAALTGLSTAAILLLLGLWDEPVLIFTNTLAIDSFGHMAKLIMTLGTLGAIFISRPSRELKPSVKSEFAIMALGVLVGGMLLSSALNMLILYIGIEMLSILSYVMASLKKNDEYSSEAGLKYALYGGFSSALMLFGMGHLYGALGTIHFGEMADLLKGLDSSEALILIPAFILFFAGLGHKIACVPFHMWTPDVYEGSPTPVAAFFSIVPKIAGITALLRITLLLFSDEHLLSHSWILLLQVVGILTMTVGNVSAIGQKSVKRMLAYSSISHSGMMVLGILIIDEEATGAILFYGFVYLFMALSAFTVTSFVQNQYGNDHFERFSGLAFKHPSVAFVTAVVMFSLAGIPPLSGFAAKFNIIVLIISKKYYVVAVLALLNSVVSLYYYLKLVKFMIFRPPESDEPLRDMTFVRRSMFIGLGIPVVAFGIFWSKIYHIAKSSTLFLEN